MSKHQLNARQKKKWVRHDWLNQRRACSEAALKESPAS